MPKAQQSSSPAPVPNKGVVLPSQQRHKAGKARVAKRIKSKPVGSIAEALAKLSNRRITAIGYSYCVHSWQATARAYLRKELVPLMRRLMQAAFEHTQLCGRKTVSDKDVLAAAEKVANLHVYPGGDMKIDCQKQRALLRLIDDPTGKKQKQKKQEDAADKQKKNKNKSKNNKQKSASQ